MDRRSATLGHTMRGVSGSEQEAAASWRVVRDRPTCDVQQLPNRHSLATNHRQRQDVLLPGLRRGRPVHLQLWSTGRPTDRLSNSPAQSAGFDLFQWLWRSGGAI